MKKTLFYIFILFVFPGVSWAQLNVNGRFLDFNLSSTCVIPSNGTCATFNSGCVVNWERSHGSPQIKEELIITPKTIRNYFGYMWSQNANDGEGMYTSFNFIANRPYRLKINARAALTSGATGGRMRIFLANGLTPHIVNDCGSPVAVPTSSQDVAVGGQSGIPGVWTEYIYTFIPNSSYTQLYIYAQNDGGGQYNLDIDAIDISYDCEGVKVYNTGVVPSGETKAGYITAGSGNSTVVTVSPSTNTTFLAAREITLTPEFNAVVTAGVSFSASIYDCQPYQLRKAYVDDSLPPLPMQHSFDDHVAQRTTVPTNSKAITSFNLYPNPSTGKLIVTVPITNESQVDVVITNSTGVVVKRLKRNLTHGLGSILEINTMDLSAGIYFIQVGGKGKKFISKFIMK